MTSAILTPSLTFKSWLANGTPNAFGTVTTYQAGTTTPIASYTDYTAGTPNANPLTLNARGEANIWLTPNIAYKVVEQDSVGNLIKTTDQVLNSQSVSVYGGTDTGTVNAYSLSFLTTFGNLGDGTVLTWLPASTNTSTSTLNSVSIVNPGGQSLSAGQIVVNKFVTIVYKGGIWYLQSTGNVPFTSTFTGTLTGFTGVVQPVLTTVINGNMISLTLPLATTGTSNTTAMTMTGLSGFLLPARNLYVPCMLEDNGVVQGGWALVQTSGTIAFGLTFANTVFTNSGVKGLPLGFCITYPTS